MSMFNQRVFVFSIVVTVAIYFAYCIRPFYFSSGPRPTSYEALLPDKRRPSMPSRLRDILQSSYLKIHPFNINGHDIMVFLHIQKTGGTSFGKNLVKNLHLERKCDKVVKLNAKSRFMCKRPDSDEFWLYSRYSTGWVCGLHADWTTWTTCLPKLLKSRLSEEHYRKVNLFYITILRDPVDRFLSEFKHVERGATWMSSKFICNNKQYNPPICFNGTDWSTVTLSKFLDCPYNLAFNRQTRMLANLTEVGCYNNNTENVYNFSKHLYGKTMLESAKRNLRSMAYFGLLEYQKESQYLFEKTFGLKFKKKFSQVPVNETISGETALTLTTKLTLRIGEVTRLDRQLYSYAKTLFFKRLKYFDKIDEIDDFKASPAI